MIRAARKEKDIGLRELSRRIKKSPAFLTQIETDNPPPPVAEDTLRDIAREVGLDGDVLVILSKRAPEDAAPTSVLELELFRTVKSMSEARQRRVLQDLKQRKKQ
jgi:transcriptional regulator with XRE-family HTH domain